VRTRSGIVSIQVSLVLLAFVLPAFGGTAPATEDTCPAHLFVLGRSKNANIVVYDASRGPAGDLAASAPVVAYWLLNGDKTKREELNRVERERAYGFDVSPGDTSGTYAMTLKASRTRRLTVRIQSGCPVVITPIGGRDGILRKMFVQAKDDSLRPKVEFVELFGEDLSTGEPLYEKFVPGK
jgi:hypothetical protein